MTTPLLMALPGNEAFAGRLGTALGLEVGEIEARKFPDGETYLRFRTDPKGRSLILICTLDSCFPELV